MKMTTKYGLTESGKTVLQMVTILVVLSNLMVIIGWIQLHVLGIALTPEVPVDTVFEYYLYTGSVGLMVLIILAGLGLAIYKGIFRLSRLFRCSESER
jgi:uncharacterized membrane protein